jgi:diaminopimelate epimerase
MKWSFSKYSGCGNDFILFDNRKGNFPSQQKDLVVSLCNRQKGIGADGVILLETSQKADYRMRIFNADGSEAEMCGNGIRCLYKFLQEFCTEQSACRIETLSKILKVESKDDEVAVLMGDPTEVHWNIPFSRWTVHHLDTGVPHAIIFSDLDNLDLFECGREIRFHKRFAPRGANANFASVDEDKTVHIRTYERGVEKETLACGTGATACALAAAQIYGLPAPIQVKVRSGDVLKVDFRKNGNDFCDVRLIGPAEPIFSGTITLN